MFWYCIIFEKPAGPIIYPNETVGKQVLKSDIGIAVRDALARIGVDITEELCFEPIESHALGFAPFAEVKTQADFFRAKSDYILEVIASFAERGVKFISTDGVVISPFAKIGAGTVIHPNTQIRSGVTIGEECVIGPCSVIERSTIGSRCIVNATQIYDSVLEDDVKIGPFCHIRPNSRLCRGVKIGDFVEVKNSTVGEGTQAAHLTYIGDSDVGARVNFGCGVVAVNYDGKTKHRTVICDDAFIGCNTNLVAPVTVGERAYTAAGSTITEDVPADALAIARARQVNKPGWRRKKQNQQ